MLPVWLKIAAAAILPVCLLLLVLYGVVGPSFTKTNRTDILPAGDPSAPRVLILGTSLTSRGDWPERLAGRLEDCGVTVETLAKPGGGSSWGLAKLEEWFAAGNAAGLVIVEFSGNDASPIRGAPLFMSRKTHRRIIETATENGALVSLATMSPAWGMNALERPGQDRYHAIYRDLARSGVGLIDTIDVWRALTEEDRARLVPDGLHPTEEGMALIAVPAFARHVRAVFCK